MVDDRAAPRAPDDPPADDEAAAAADLRAALDDPARASADAELARALAAAWSPKDLSAGEHRAALERALARWPAAGRRRRPARRAAAAGALLALAAGVGAVLWSADRASAPAASPAAAAPLARRSTQPLFADPFPAAGGERARIDRIAIARAADLRDNEFARWGVR